MIAEYLLAFIAVILFLIFYNLTAFVKKQAEHNDKMIELLNKLKNQ